MHPLDSIGIITCTKHHLICNKEQLEQGLLGQLNHNMGNVNIYDNMMSDVSALPLGIKNWYLYLWNEKEVEASHHN